MAKRKNQGQESHEQTQEEWEDENLPGWIIEQLNRDDKEDDDEATQ